MADAIPDRLTGGPAVAISPAPWVGWCRPSSAARRVWRRVAEGATEAEAWDGVYRVMDGERGGARDWVVLPEGQKP